jgi:transcriptional regulator with XRE-family HTH domain
MPPRAVVDQRFAARLRQLRAERGLSLRALARAVPCSHVYVWELEQGRKLPTLATARCFDAALGSGDELATLVATMPASPECGDGSNGWQPWAEGFGRRDAETLAAMLVAEVPLPGNALRLAHEWLVAEPPQVYEVRAGRRIGAATLARVEQRVHQLRLLDDHVGGTDSYAVVRAELIATAELLRGASYTEPVGRRLLVAIGELAQLAGWVASDAGRHAEAERLYLAGARAAQAGGDVAGAANNLSSLAYQIANVGDRHDAVVLARTAVVRTQRDAPATVQALLWERAAWAHARAGEAGLCDRALGNVEDAYADRDPGDDPMWVYWLDAAEIEVMAGRCWTELARPLRAVPILRRATVGYGGDRARESALYLSWLADALLQAHEIEEAATTALTALTLARQVHSTRANQRIALLHQRLHPLPGVAGVDEFDDAYHAEGVSGRSEPAC